MDITRAVWTCDGRSLSPGLMLALCGLAAGFYWCSYCVPSAAWHQRYEFVHWLGEFGRCIIASIWVIVWLCFTFKRETALVLGAPHAIGGGIMGRRLRSARTWLMWSIIAAILGTIWMNQGVLPLRLAMTPDKVSRPPLFLEHHLPYLVFLPNSLIFYGLFAPVILWATWLAFLVSIRRLRAWQSRVRVLIAAQRPMNAADVEKLITTVDRFRRSFSHDLERFLQIVILYAGVLAVEWALDSKGLAKEATIGFWIVQALLLSAPVGFVLAHVVYGHEVAAVVRCLEARRVDRCELESFHARNRLNSVLLGAIESNLLLILIFAALPMVLSR